MQYRKSALSAAIVVCLGRLERQRLGRELSKHDVQDCDHCEGQADRHAVDRAADCRQAVGEGVGGAEHRVFDRRAGDVVALARQVRQHLPFVGRRVVDGEVVPARHPRHAPVGRRRRRLEGFPERRAG